VKKPTRTRKPTRSQQGHAESQRNMHASVKACKLASTHWEPPSHSLRGTAMPCSAVAKPLVSKREGANGSNLLAPTSAVHSACLCAVVRRCAQCMSVRVVCPCAVVRRLSVRRPKNVALDVSPCQMHRPTGKSTGDHCHCRPKFCIQPKTVILSECPIFASVQPPSGDYFEGSRVRS
jgi:hypothetical protein